MVRRGKNQPDFASDYLNSIRSLVKGHRIFASTMSPTIGESIELNHESMKADEQVSKIIFGHSNLFYSSSAECNLSKVDSSDVYKKFFVRVPSFMTIYFHNFPGIKGEYKEMKKIFDSLVRGDKTRFFIKKTYGECV